MIQHITYEEHLPTLLGPVGHDMVVNAPAEEPDVLQMPGFSPAKQSDPSIRNEFNVAGYRWGHAQIPDRTDTADGNLNVKEFGGKNHTIWSRSSKMDIKF